MVQGGTALERISTEAGSGSGIGDREPVLGSRQPGGGRSLLPIGTWYYGTGTEYSHSELSTNIPTLRFAFYIYIGTSVHRYIGRLSFLFYLPFSTISHSVRFFRAYRT